MGQSQATKALKDTKFELKVDENLNNMLKEEIKPLNIKKTVSKKGTKFLKFSGRGKPKKQIYVKDSEIFNLSNDSDEEDSEEESEIYINYITELVDLIYSKNINLQLKNRPNNTVYETVFDIRNILDTKEDLNNNEYNNKSCQVMNELIEPDFSDIINNDKKEKKNDDNEKDNKDIEEQEKNSSSEEKSESLENDFFKNWDYQEDIFEREKEEENEIELSLDFYDKYYNKGRNKGKEINQMSKSTDCSRRGKGKLSKTLIINKTDNKLLKKSPSVYNKKTLIFLEDIIKYNKDNDINKFYSHILDNINRYNNIMSLYINNNIKENNNNIEKITDKVSINENKGKNSIEKKPFINKIKDTSNQTENFEIINNEELLNESGKNNKNINNDNSNDSILRNNKNISKYFKDDEKSENFGGDGLEKNTKNELMDFSNTSCVNENSANLNINEKNIPKTTNYKKSFKKTIVYNKSKSKGILKKNSNIKLYKRKKLDLTNKTNDSNNNSKDIKTKPFILQDDNNEGNIDFNDISAIQKNENLDINTPSNTNFNLDRIYSPRKIRAKTQIIKKPRNKIIKRKKLIFNVNDKEKEKDNNLKPFEFDQSQLYVTRAENLLVPKSDKKYISKTPVKLLNKKKEVNPKHELKINLREEEFQKDKMNNDINDINKTIALVEQKINSIERIDKRYKSIYNINNVNNKYTSNNINIKNISHLEKHKRHKKKNKLRTQKTFEEIDAKGYKEIMPQINREREEKNNINYNPISSNRTKSSDIQLRKKKTKKENKAQNYENINNYVFGKQQYYNYDNHKEKGNINTMRIGTRKKI